MTIKDYNDYISINKSFLFENGIWYSSISSKLSYPDEYHDDFFELEESSFWFRHRNNYLISVIKKYSKGDCFFDIGGGNGFVAKGLENNQITYDAI